LHSNKFFINILPYIGLRDPDLDNLKESECLNPKVVPAVGDIFNFLLDIL
jgi:hypothetical protein